MYYSLDDQSILDIAYTHPPLHYTETYFDDSTFSNIQSGYVFVGVQCSEHPDMHMFYHRHISTELDVPVSHLPESVEEVGSLYFHRYVIPATHIVDMCTLLPRSKQHPKGELFYCTTTLHTDTPTCSKTLVYLCSCNDIETILPMDLREKVMNSDVRDVIPEDIHFGDDYLSDEYDSDDK